MIFPAAGYYVGHLIFNQKTEKDLKEFWKKMILAGVIGLLAVGICLRNYGLDPYLIAAPTANQYFVDLSSVVMDLLIACIWYGLLYFLCNKIPMPAVLKWGSRFSNAILIFYCASWVLLGWLE